jgi:hypothetical protein
VDKHLQVALHNGFATAARLVARLHALNIVVAELHMAGERLCIHLADDAALSRVRAVLARCVDVDLVRSATAPGPPCLRPPIPTAVRNTTYVVTSQPLPSPGAPAQRRPRISA